MIFRVSDVYENFIASVLGTLLTDGPSAPFYKSLVESGLGANYSPMTGKAAPNIYNCCGFYASFAQKNFFLRARNLN